MTFLNASTTEELRAAIEKRRDPISDFIADLEVDAQIEAKRFVGDRTMPWLLDIADTFIERAMSAATNGTGFKTVPEPGRAILVQSNGFAIHEMGDPETYGFRWWKYVRELKDGTQVEPGWLVPCHRCDLPGWVRGHHEGRAIDVVFYIARGRYVVEFALCADCAAHYAAIAD